jgi:hypothetical protein
MTGRILPTAVFTIKVTAIALAAVLAVSAALHSTPVNISTGITAGWLASLFLPCPCHRAGQR